jgi:hypothetical protein
MSTGHVRRLSRRPNPLALATFDRRIQQLGVGRGGDVLRLHKYLGGYSEKAVLSVITGGGKWVEITTHADPLYQHLIVTAERKFWRCVESGEPLASLVLNHRSRGSRPSGLWI